jgi:type II secretory pathway pseudopilin PulG
VTRATRDERGETLVELLATIVIMGTAVVAVIAGIGVAITASDANAKQVTALTVVRNYAEAIQAGRYVPCATAASYAPAAVAFTPPPNFTVSVTGSVAYYDGTSTAPAVFAAACPSPDMGAQQFTIRAQSTDNRADRSLQIVKRGP